MSEHIPAGYSSAQDYARAQAAMGGNYGRGVGRAEVMPEPTPSATYTAGNGGPVSEQYLRQQHDQRVVAETSSWFDYHIGNGRAVNGVSSDHDPAGYLRQHGFIAVNGAGEEVTPSPMQARGLVKDGPPGQQDQPQAGHTRHPVPRRQPPACTAAGAAAPGVLSMNDTDEFRSALAEGNRPETPDPASTPPTWQERYGYPWSETIPRAWGSFEAFEKSMQVEGAYLQALETLREGGARGLTPAEPGSYRDTRMSWEDDQLRRHMYEAERWLRLRRR